MKTRVVYTWPKTEAAQWYRLFAEQCQELVHARSQEPHRVQALSTPAKIAELIVNCRKVLDKQFPKPTLTPMIDELTDTLGRDPIIAKILNDKRIEVDIIIPSMKHTTEEILSRARLAEKIISEDYRRRAEGEIIEECRQRRSKQNLIILAAHYVAELIHLGFHREFVSRTTQQHFFDRNINRCSPRLLESYFERLGPAEKKEFKVVARTKNDYATFLSEKFALATFETYEKLPDNIRALVPASFHKDADRRALLRNPRAPRFA